MSDAMTAGIPAPDGFTTWKRLLGYTARYWQAILLAMFGFALFGAMESAGAWSVKYLIDHLNSHDPQLVWMLPVMIVFIALGRSLGSFIGDYGISYTARNVVNSLRCEMFARMLGLPTQYYLESTTGHLVAKLTYNVEQVTSAATDSAKVVFKEGVTVVALLAYLFWMSWSLTLILFAVLPLIGLLVRTASKRFRKISGRLQASVGEITHVASEAVNGVQIVKLFAGAENERRRFDKVSRLNMQQSMKMMVTRASNSAAIQFILAIPIAIIASIALSQAAHMTTGEFVSYFGAIGMMIKPSRTLSDINERLQRGITAARSIFEVIDYPAEDAGGTHAPERVRGDVEFRDVTFRYPGKDEDVLRGVSFRVAAGQTVALVGRSGGGKTTMSNLLPRFYDVTAGQVLVDGVPVRQYALPALRRQMSLVPQRVVLFDDSVAANIAYGSLSGADMKDIVVAAEAANATGFIENLPQGFATRIGQDGMQLSGGQRQRLAIARALLRNAPILILDEATSALDTESEKHIQDALERLMKGRTTFVIAHRLSTIERADLILVIAGGRIVEQGTHAELLARGGEYARMHQRNFADDVPDSGA